MRPEISDENADNKEQEVQKKPEINDENKSIANNKEEEVQKKPFIWRPMPSIFSTALCFGILGLLMVIIGIILLTFSSQIVEYLVKYDQVSCIFDCEINFSISTDIEPPIMVYYQLDNYYQNHRRYIRSKSQKQLAGQVFNNLTSKVDDWNSFKVDCDPIITVKDLGINTTIGGRVALPPNAPANPCGLIAKSIFNDTYKLYSNNLGVGYNIYINESNIAWPEDKVYRFIKPENYSDLQWLDINDEHFMVWMRPAAIPNFRKLWGRIKTKLTAGNYTLVFNNTYPVKSFKGSKTFVLSTCNVFGGKNSFLGIAYICVGIVCLIFAILFWLGYKDYHKEKAD